MHTIRSWWAGQVSACWEIQGEGIGLAAIREAVLQGGPQAHQPHLWPPRCPLPNFVKPHTCRAM